MTAFEGIGRAIGIAFYPIRPQPTFRNETLCSTQSPRAVGDRTNYCNPLLIVAIIIGISWGSLVVYEETGVLRRTDRLKYTRGLR